VKNELELLRDRLRVKGLDKRLRDDLLQCEDSPECLDIDDVTINAEYLGSEVVL
jgi:hypothetical protein